MAAGKAFTFTPTRIKETLSMLSQGHTVSSIAQHYGLHHSTLRDKLAEAGIDAKAIRNNGGVSMRVMLYNTVMAIPDEAKRADAAIKYLNQYPIVEDEADTLVDDATSDEAIRLQIINELSEPFVGSNITTLES